MTKLYESDCYGYGESGTSVTVYLLTEEEANEYWSLSEEELLEILGLPTDLPYEVAPGSIYHTYEAQVQDALLVVYEHSACNV